MELEICRICEGTENLYNIFQEDSNDNNDDSNDENGSVNNNNRNFIGKLQIFADVEINMDDGLPKYICDGCSHLLDQSVELRNRILFVDRKFKLIYKIIRDARSGLLPLNLCANNSVTKTPSEDVKHELNSPPPQPLTSQTPIAMGQQTAAVAAEASTALPSSTKSTNNLEQPQTVIVKQERINNTEQFNLTKCLNCGEQFYNLFQFVEHKNVCQPTTEAAQQTPTHQTLPQQYQHKNQNLLKPPKKKHKEQQNLNLTRETLSIPSSPHSTTLNGDDRPFRCDYCPKTFATKQHAGYHLLVHTGEKPYSCDFCKKSFPLSATLKRHLKIHTGERPFKCDFCPKSFLTKQQFKHHRLIHTGEKPYPCIFCGKRFNQPSNLGTHVKKAHAELAGQNGEWRQQLARQMKLERLMMLQE